MKIIGITGGVGAGKTTLLTALNEVIPSYILLSDEAAHKVEMSGTNCFNELINLLGKDVLSDDGEIDKKKMASMIFSDGELLSKINAIVHPAVKKYILNEIKKEKDKNEKELFFIEAALLIECGYKEIVDEMWYVYASDDVRRRRLKESRSYSDEKIDNIFASQLSDEEFRKNSDFVIDNSGTVEDSISQIIKRIGL